MCTEDTICFAKKKQMRGALQVRLNNDKKKGK